MSSIFSIGDVARHFGCQTWKVRRLIERGLYPEPSRVGMYRVFSDDDLPGIEVALIQAGYLPATN